MTSNATSLGYEVEDVGFYIYYFGIMGLLTCVNIPGNILVITTILRHRDLRINSNYLLVNQAAADLLYGVLYPVYNFAQMTIVPSVVEAFADYTVCTSFLSFLADYTACTFFISQVLTVVFCSPINLMVVTLDRFIAIVYPFRYEQHVTAKSTLIAIASVWIFSELYSISVHVIYPPRSDFKICRYEDMFNVLQTLLMNLATGLTPLGVMIFLYIRIVKVVRTQSRSIAVQLIAVEATSNDNANSRKVPKKTKENKSTALISLLLLFYFCAWCPVLVYFLYVMLTKTKPSPYFGATCRIFVFTNSCVNVFVYSLRLQNFRKYLMKDIRLCCKKFCDYLPEKKRRSYRINRLDRGDISTDRNSLKLSGRADISIINIQ